MFKYKFLKIILPNLLVTMLLLCLGIFIHYYLDFSWHLISISNHVYTAFFSIIFAAIYLYLWLKYDLYSLIPIKLFKYVYLFMPLLLALIPGYLVQNYLTEAPYPLISIEQPADIVKHPHDRYFKIKHIEFADKKHMISDYHRHTQWWQLFTNHIHWFFGSTAKTFITLNFAIPVITHSHSTNEPSIWLMYYHKKTTYTTDLKAFKKSYINYLMSDNELNFIDIIKQNQTHTYYYQIIVDRDKHILKNDLKDHHLPIPKQNIIVLEPVELPFRNHIDLSLKVIIIISGIIWLLFIASTLTAKLESTKKKIKHATL